jgi:hypothetical protein
MILNGTPQPYADPSATVLAAYRAANLGRYAKADAYVDPAVFRTLTRANVGAVNASRQIQGLLARLNGHQDDAALQCRGTLRVLLDSLHKLTTPKLGSARHRRELWDKATRNRSLAFIEAPQQLVDGALALVQLKLTLKDGTVVRDSEPLVFQRGRWLLG